MRTNEKGKWFDVTIKMRIFFMEENLESWTRKKGAVGYRAAVRAYLMDDAIHFLPVAYPGEFAKIVGIEEKPKRRRP